jgi:hypothetical protein
MTPGEMSGSFSASSVGDGELVMPELPTLGEEQSIRLNDMSGVRPHLITISDIINSPHSLLITQRASITQKHLLHGGYHQGMYSSNDLAGGLESRLLNTRSWDNSTFSRQ